MGKGPILGRMGKELCPSVCHGIVDMQGRCPHDRLADFVGKVSLLSLMSFVYESVDKRK
jgi:hypothetical protein